MSVKEIALEVIRQLPTHADVLEEIAILAAIERGRQAARWTISRLNHQGECDVGERNI